MNPLNYSIEQWMMHWDNANHQTLNTQPLSVENWKIGRNKNTLDPLYHSREEWEQIYEEGNLNDLNKYIDGLDDFGDGDFKFAIDFEDGYDPYENSLIYK